MSEPQAAQTPICEHYWCWTSLAGSNKSARVCMSCNAINPEWLNNMVEVRPVEAKRLYPKEPKSKLPTAAEVSCRYYVKYDLIYDGGSIKWTGYYRTRLGARFFAALNYHILSWGGEAVLFENSKE